MTQLISVTDGRVSIRSEDRAGAGPVAAVLSGDVVAGWISYDGEWGRLALGEVLVRYEMRARSGGQDGAADGDDVLRRPIPPVRYTDGVVTIRRQRADDIDRHLEAIDGEQVDWL